MDKDSLEILLLSLSMIPFLFFSFFFSGTETALFSMNKLERETFKKKHSIKQANFIKKIFSTPDQILVTILTGNMIINVLTTDFFSSMLSEKISVFLGHFDPDFFSIMIMTPIILICGEMTPKNIAMRYPLKFANFATVPLKMLHTGLRPITAVLNAIRMKLMADIPHTETDKKELLGNMVSFVRKFGYKAGIINRFELELFESYFELQNNTASDVMSPRIELNGVDVSTELPALLKMVGTDPRFMDETYIYVYRDNLDNLLGYIDVKDLLPYKYGLKKENWITSVMKPFYLIPETKKINALLVDLKESGSEIALVIDEYGGTAGIITFHNLVKNMLDYFYENNPEAVMKVADNCYFADGAMEIDALKDLIDVEFVSEKRTISGIIIEHLGEIPEVGTNVNIQGVEFEVVKVDKNKVLGVRIWYRR
ncbi:MAG: HlyC/CorC family transporter [Spirochaetales bacterium]|nr:HlyC/CorC family transporter [Spirochaetales bacterium]